MDQQADRPNGVSIKTYATGFLLSLILTLVSYGLVQRHVSSHHTFLSDHFLIFMVLSYAVIQFLVQMVFFLHIDIENKPRFKRLTLWMMGTFVLIVVLGSIWIMHSLNYRMTPQQINQYMQNQANSGL